MDHYDELEALKKTGNVVGQIETLTPHKLAVVVLTHEYIKVGRNSMSQQSSKSVFLAGKT